MWMPGFERSHLVTFSLTLAEPYEPDTRAQAYRRILNGLLAVPAYIGSIDIRSPPRDPCRQSPHESKTMLPRMDARLRSSTTTSSSWATTFAQWAFRLWQAEASMALREPPMRGRW